MKTKEEVEAWLKSQGFVHTMGGWVRVERVWIADALVDDPKSFKEAQAMHPEWETRGL